MVKCLDGCGGIWRSIYVRGRRRGLWEAITNADMTEFVIDMCYDIHSDLSKRMGDVRLGIKVGGIQ